MSFIQEVWASIDALAAGCKCDDPLTKSSRARGSPWARRTDGLAERARQAFQPGAPECSRARPPARAGDVVGSYFDARPSHDADQLSLQTVPLQRHLDRSSPRDRTSDVVQSNGAPAGLTYTTGPMVTLTPRREVRTFHVADERRPEAHVYESTSPPSPNRIASPRHQLPACVRMGKSEVNELARKFEEREETANKQQATSQMHVGAHTEEDEDSGEVSEDIHSHSDAEGDVGAC